MDWTPAAILPNISAHQAVDGDVVALAPRNAPRVQAFCDAHPVFRDFISRFTDAFNVTLDPVILIVRNDVISKFGQVESLASFRDLVTISVIPYVRAAAAVNGNRHRICYSNFFGLYPWMVGTDNVHIVKSTPAVQALHVVEQFHGQSSPELSPLVLADLDEPLFHALLLRWKRHYLGKRQRWKDRALFRSLNMANQASQIPAGIDTTVYDLGRMIALWVSAFEILTHPRKGNAGLGSVYTCLGSVSHIDRRIRQRRYSAYMGQKKKPWPRRTLPCWLYGILYRARCDFLHGNPVRPKSLNPAGLKVGLFWLAPLVYRLALGAFLGISRKRRIPKGNDLPKLAEYIASDLRFERHQRTIERAAEGAEMTGQ